MLSNLVSSKKVANNKEMKKRKRFNKISKQILEDSSLTFSEEAQEKIKTSMNLTT
jgi:hypothetical protein